MDRSSIYNSSESSPNLYESKALGSKNEIPEIESMTSLRRFFREQNAKMLSNFSNVCEKLQIPVPVRENAWTEFQRLNRKVRRKAAEHACFALYNACRISLQTYMLKEVLTDGPGLQYLRLSGNERKGSACGGRYS